MQDSEVSHVGDLERGNDSIMSNFLPPENKYSSDEMCEKVQTEYFAALSEVLEATSTKENPRVLLKLLLAGVEYEDVRLIASSMLEGFINNPVHMHAAKALLGCIVQKIHSISKSDINTVGNLFLLKIKDQHNTIYRDMVIQLVCRRRVYAAVGLKALVLVELSAKNISNLKNISTILRAISVFPPLERELAMLLQELAVNDDIRVNLKDFVCRMIRHVGPDINIQDLCRGLLQPWGAIVNQNESLKVAWLTEMVELVSAILLHSTAAFAMDESIMAILSPAETAILFANTRASTSKEKVEALSKFSLDVATIQLQAMAWCADVVAAYVPHMNEVWFANILRKFLFLENCEAYFPKGKYFGEFECNSLQLLGSCTHASEELLARVILMGISDVYPLTMGDALSIIESLVWRAGAFNKQFKGNLHAESKKLPAAILKLASFNLAGIAEQSLSDIVCKDKYWRACLLVVLLAVYNPGTIGQYVWENNPTIRCMMEALIMDRTKFTSSIDETSGNLKLGELESDARGCDTEAEAAIISFLSYQKHAEGTVSGDVLPDISEWKGNVMFMNRSVSLTKPPGWILKELNQADKIYQLGHELRECRHPDFLAKTTSLQTLPKAWPWLRRILHQEPQLVCVLPLAWQCELLCLLEGLTACGRKHFGNNVQLLYLALCKVIMDKACEKEAKYVVEYFSFKFADKCGLVRSQARRCFAGLFDTLFVLLKRVSSFGHGAESHLAKSGSFFDGPDLERDETLSKCFKHVPATDYYDLRWMEGIESLPYAHVIFQSLLPAIQAAVQVETCIEVVSLYLMFLKKYSPRPPSVFSLACTIAKLFEQRKDFAACMVLRTRGNDSHMVHPSSAVLGEHISAEDIILNSLCEALIVGISSVLNDDEAADMKSPLVTVVSHQNVDGKTSSSMRITLQKIVLDAILGVLSLWFNEKNKDTRKKDSVEKMIEILLPNVSGKTRVAWLESGNGQQLPLLSENQAIAFSRSTDERIAIAGHDALSLHASMHLCKGLGIPRATVDFVLTTVNSTDGARLQELLNAKKMEENQTLILLACLQTLSKIANKSFPNLLRLPIQFTAFSVSQISLCTLQQSLLPDSVSTDADAENYRNASTGEIMDCVIGYLAKSDLKNNLCLLSGVSDFMFTNVQLRKHIQKEVCYGSGFSLIKFLETSLRKFQVFEDHRLSWMHLNFLLLPALAVLINLNYSVLGNFGSINIAKLDSEREAQVEYQGYLRNIMSQMESELDNCFLSNNIATDLKKSIVILHLKFIMAELVVMCEATHEKSYLSSQKSVFKAMHANYQESWSSIDFGYFPMLGVEGTLHTFLQQKLKQVSFENVCFEFQPATITLEMMQFIFSISREDGDYLKYVSNFGEDIEAYFRKDILLLGCYGLASEFSKFLDMNMSSTLCIPSNFQLPEENAKDASLQEHVHSFTRLYLENVVHQSSWQVRIQVLKYMLEMFGTTLPLTALNDRGNSETLIMHMLRVFGLIEPDLISVLEFLHSCSLHVCSVLPHRLSDQLEIQERRNNIAVPLFPPSSVHFLVNLALQAFANVGASKKIHQSFQEEPSLQIIAREDFFSLAINLLVSSASASGNVLHLFIQHLLSLDRNGMCDSTANNFVGCMAFQNVFPTAVKELLWTVYFAFPLSVSSILQSGNAFFTNNTIQGINMLHNNSFLFCRCDKAFPMYKIVHNALKIVCEGNEEESDAAYGFCHYVAKEHPLLLLLHICTLAALLKEKMPLMKQRENNGRSIGHALHLVAGLLDALRPHIFDVYNCDQLWDNVSQSGLKASDLPNFSMCLWESDKVMVHVSKSWYFSKGSLEVMLDIYLEFLKMLDAASLPQFLKAIIRFTDFLCYCVAAGKRCLDIVSRHRKLIQTLSQKFAKIKKLGYLLSLIDNLDSSVNYGGIDIDEVLERQFQTQDMQLGLPMLPIDDVLKVQRQLQHFLSLQTYILDDWSVTHTEPETVQQPERKLKNPALEDEIGLLSTLNDVEKASARLPTILTYLEESLVKLIKIKNAGVQEIVYQLLERFLFNCPSENGSRKVVEALLHNLKSSDISLARLAARQTVKFFYHWPDLQETILVELFAARSLAKKELQQLLRVLLLISNGHEGNGLGMQ